MDCAPYPSAPDVVVWRVVVGLIRPSAPHEHDIPHPIGDPDEDEGLPDSEDDEDDEEEEDEEPLQVQGRPQGLGFAPQHIFGFSGIIKPLRRSANEFFSKLS